MKLEQLQHIIEIDKQRSITKAAKALFIGQPTVSGSLSTLEEEIGIRLFKRTSSGVEPTAEGEEALQLAKKIIENAEQLLNLGQKERELYGKVTVTIGVAYSFLFTDFFLKFTETFPKAELDLQICSPDQIMEELLSGRSDMVLALFPEGSHELSRLQKINYQYEILGSCNYQVYVGRENLLAPQQQISKEELKGKKLITNSIRVCDYMRQEIAPEQEIMIVTDKDALNQLICSSDMVAFLPELFALKNLHCETGLIKNIQMQEDTIRASFVMTLIYSKKQTLTLLEQGALQALQEILQQLKPE